MDNMMRFKKKPVLIAATASHLVTAIGWCGWFVWTGPYGPTHVTVLPYVQPGTNAVVLDGFDSSRLVWVARGRLAEYSVDYGTSSAYGQTVRPTHVEIPAARHAHKHVATLTRLPLDSTCFYRVRLGDTVVREDH